MTITKRKLLDVVRKEHLVLSKSKNPDVNKINTLLNLKTKMMNGTTLSSREFIWVCQLALNSARKNE